MIESASSGPTRVFISYSRRDQDFVARLAKALTSIPYFVDFDLGGDSAKIEGGIAPTDAWRDRLRLLIAAADVVIFVVSPDSAASPVCDWEIGEAQSLGKRLIPVLWRRIDFSGAPERLAALNVAISFEGDFDNPVGRLVQAIDVDVEWLREGRRLTTLAVRWRENGEPESQLLRAGEVSAAEAWAARRPPNAPAPAELLFRFFDASRAKEESDLTRLRTITARGYVAQTQKAYADGECEEALRLATAGMLLSDDLNFDLAPELWDAVAPAIFENRLLCVLHPSPRNGVSSKRESPEEIQFTPNGERLLIVSGDGAASVWNLLTGEQDWQLGENAPATRTAAVSPDGSRIATAGEAQGISVRDSKTGQLIVTAGPENTYHHLSFSPDGSQVWTDIGAFDARTGKQTRKISDRAQVWRMTISPDGKHVASGNWSDESRAGSEVILWHAQSGNEARRISLKRNNVTQLSFSPDSKRLLILSEEHNIAEGRGTEFGPDKYQALIADVATGNIVCALSGHEGHINSAAFDSAGARIVTSSDDRTVRVWDALTGAELSKRAGAPFRGQSGRLRGFRDVCFAPNRPIVASASNNGSVEIWHCESGQHLRTLTHIRRSRKDKALLSDGVMAVGFDAAGCKLFSAAEDGSVNVWDAAIGSQTLVLDGHVDVVSFVAASPTGDLIATIEGDHTLRIFSGASGALAVQFDLPEARFRSSDALGGEGSVCWFSSSGKRLIAISSNGELSRRFEYPERSETVVRVWETSSWQQVQEIRGKGSIGHLDASERFAGDSDRQQLEGLGADMAASHRWKRKIVAALERIWKAEQIEAARYQNSYRVSDDGCVLVQFGIWENEVTIWDVAANAKVTSFEGSSVDAACDWTADGKRLLMARDGVVCIVGIPEGRILFRLNEPQARSVSLSEDGSRLVVGLADGTARVFDVSRTAAIVGDRASTLFASIVAGVGRLSARERELPSLADAPEDLHKALAPRLSPKQSEHAARVRQELFRGWALDCYRPALQMSPSKQDWSPALEALRITMVNQCVSGLFGEDSKPKSIEAHAAERIAHDLTRAALANLVAAQVASAGRAENSEKGEVSTYLSEALAVVEDLHYANLGHDDGQSEPHGIWWTDVQPLWTIKNKKHPILDTRAIAATAERYLQVGYRTPSFDRLLVRSLIAGEMYAFGDAVYHKGGGPSERRMMWELAGTWLLTPLVTLGLGGWGLAQALRAGIVGEWAHWIGFALGAVFGMIGLVLPGIVGGELKSQISRRAKFEKLLGTMILAFQSVPDVGPFSANEVRGKVDAAAQLGAVWPSGLFAVLEDVQIRS